MCCAEDDVSSVCHLVKIYLNHLRTCGGLEEIVLSATGCIYHVLVHK